MSDSQLRYAIVTGAASGLGRALAVRLARDGWQIAVADIDTAGAEETLRLVFEAGGGGRVERLDVTRLDEWQQVVDRLKGDWPQLDLLVNNAGIVAAGEVGQLAIDDWRRTIDTSLWGTIHGCHACASWLKINQTGAHILNIGSIAGLISPPTMGAYNVAKAGIVSLSETLHVELARHRVGVTVVCTGFFRTRLLEVGVFNEPAQRSYAEAITRRAKITAEMVAEEALKGVARNEFMVVLPARARRLWRFKRWLPKVFLRWLSHEFRNGIPEP